MHHSVDSYRFRRSNLFDPNIDGWNTKQEFFLGSKFGTHILCSKQWFWCFFLLFTHFCKQFFVVIISRNSLIFSKSVSICFTQTEELLEAYIETAWTFQNRPQCHEKFVSFNDLDTGFHRTKPSVCWGKWRNCHPSPVRDDPIWQMTYFST